MIPPQPAELGNSLLSYLFNALWQVPFCAVAAIGMTSLLRQSNPSVRHRVWVGALLAETVLPALHFVKLSTFGVPWFLATLFAWSSALGHGGITLSQGAARAAAATGVATWLATFLLVAYMGSILFFIGRMTFGLLLLCKLRRRCIAAPTTGKLLHKLQTRHWCSGVQGLDVAFSDLVRTPLTFGFRKQVLLLPTVDRNSLDDVDLDAVLGHECAHIQRQDFLKNLAYLLITLPIAFHPLTWWTLRHVAETREMICDELAAVVVGGPVRYAHCLLRLTALFAQPAVPESLHAIGLFGAYQLERRVMNLTQQKTSPQGMRKLTQLVAAISLALATCTTALAFRITTVAERKITAGQQSSSPTAHVASGVMAGQIESRAMPVYPSGAKKAKIEGPVVLAARIGIDGKVKGLKVVSGPQPLRNSALAAVRQWAYKPYLMNGKPVEVETTITVTYSMAP